MIRFSIFGIPVEVQPFFWLSLVILGGSGGADTPKELFQIVLFVLAGFISVLTHELGHALTARAFGANTAITLQMFGGYASYSGVRMSRLRGFLITAAGPVIQITLGLLVLLLFQVIPRMSDNGAYFLDRLMIISLFWAILNLLPVLPLDGGQMLNAILGPNRIKITLWITIIVGVSLGLLMFFITHQPLFPIFLGTYAWQAYQLLKDNRLR
jgi:stage IV sporulation protein FB